MNTSFQIQDESKFRVLRLRSADGTNRLTRECVLALTQTMEKLVSDPKPLIIAGNRKFFSTGADLSEIADLNGPAAYQFSKMGQHLMNSIERFPESVYAAVEGYCMGGGLDLALACHCRVASLHAIFGHRGAALGLMTGWGGTQRLARLVGKARALQIFVTAEKLHAQQAFEIGLVHALVEDAVGYCISLAESEAEPKYRSLNSAHFASLARPRSG